jgi:hypothetical protein
MKEDKPKGFLKWLVSTRRLVETVIGQLSERFNIEKVRARDLWHEISRFWRKLLAHMMCVTEVPFFVKKACRSFPGR